MEQKKLPIGPEEIRKAQETLRAYRRGKANLERRIVENEQWWKLRHWSQMRPRHGAPGDPQPTSGWLVNVCLSKHADAMDAYPECVCLPREPSDKRTGDKKKYRAAGKRWSTGSIKTRNIIRIEKYRVKR